MKYRARVKENYNFYLKFSGVKVILLSEEEEKRLVL